MRIIRFNYLPHHKTYVPVVPFFIKGKVGWKEVWAYVDSGAAYTILSSDEAGRLDIDYSCGKKGMTMVGDGNLIPVFFHKLDIEIGGILFRATIAFSTNLGVGFNLLGRKDIFDRFEVVFNDPKRLITFRETKR